MYPLRRSYLFNVEVHSSNKSISQVGLSIRTLFLAVHQRPSFLLFHHYSLGTRPPSTCVPPCSRFLEIVTFQIFCLVEEPFSSSFAGLFRCWSHCVPPSGLLSRGRNLFLVKHKAQSRYSGESTNGTKADCSTINHKMGSEYRNTNTFFTMMTHFWLGRRHCFREKKATWNILFGFLPFSKVCCHIRQRIFPKPFANLVPTD